MTLWPAGGHSIRTTSEVPRSRLSETAPSRLSVTSYAGPAGECKGTVQVFCTTGEVICKICSYRPSIATPVVGAQGRLSNVPNRFGLPGVLGRLGSGILCRIRALLEK
jgi:hypothetical protein